MLLISAAGTAKFNNVEILRFTSGFRAAVGLSREVYISYRTDNPPCTANVCGSGTEFDAYDGSARVKFDAAWAKAKTEGVRHLTVKPSTTPYLTNGSLEVISNCVYTGYGATIKADTTMAVSGAKRFIIGTGSVLVPAVDNVTIEGFKFDNNINNQATTTNICVGAICVLGSFPRIINNTFVGWGQTSASLEAFVVGCFSYDTIPSVGAEVAFNKFTQEVTPITQGEATTTIVAVGSITNTSETQPTSKWSFGGKIHHNQFYNINTLPASITCIGMGAWAAGHDISFNFFRDLLVVACIRGDTGSSVDQSIHDNLGINVNIGILVEPSGGLSHTQTNLSVERNHFSITPYNAVTSAAYGIVFRDGPFVGGRVADNHVDRYGATGRVSYGLQIINTTDTLVLNNTSLNADHNLIGGTRMVFRGNTYNELEDYGSTDLKSASNYQNDGTRLVLSTDTDLYQGGNATVNNLSVLQLMAGNGSGITNTRPDAGDVNTPLRKINNAAYSIQNGKTDYIVVSTRNIAAHVWPLPDATTCNGCFRGVKDFEGDCNSTNKITITPDIEDMTIAIDEAYEGWVFISDGEEWHVWSHYVPPP